MSLDLDLVYPAPELRGPDTTQVLWSTNITHNVAPMARACGLGFLWEPDKVERIPAQGVELSCLVALDLLRTWPGRFRPLEASNGWGTYAQFLAWVGELRGACARWPDAAVRVSV